MKNILFSATSTGAVGSGAQADASLGHPADVLDMPVDPNEPTYCLCHQVSYGEMIGCDNPDVSNFLSPIFSFSNFQKFTSFLNFQKFVSKPLFKIFQNLFSNLFFKFSKIYFQNLF